MRARHRIILHLLQSLIVGLLVLGYTPAEAKAGFNRQRSSQADLTAVVNALHQPAALLQYQINSALLAALQAPEQTPTPDPDVQPILVATPLEDGSIVHVVAEGQVLIMIAEAYQITLQELLSLNNMTMKSVIYPGERLIIRLAQVTPTQTPGPPTATLFPTPTSAPTRTPTPESPQPSATASLGNAPADKTGSMATGAAASDPLLILIMVLIILGIGLVIAGSILRRHT
jgi:LysM repeat protein